MARLIEVFRRRLPRWNIVVPLAAGTGITVGLAIGAGQAVGPVLAGSVSGSAGATVEQTVLLDVDRSPDVVGANDALVVMNDDRTSFTGAIETSVGQRIAICLYLENNSGADANAMLQLEVPESSDVEAEQFSDDGGGEFSCTLDDDELADDDDGIVEEAQIGNRRWLVAISGNDDDPDLRSGEDDNDGIRVVIEPKDDAKPGFYTITGRISQISG